MNGSQSTGAVTSNQTYVLTCTGSGGSASQAATVTMTAPAPAVTFSANPSTVKNGATSTLTWSSTNATACTASGGWSGTEATSGSQTTAALTTTTQYTLTCTGAGGSASQSATVTVSAPASPSVSLSASPTSVTSGGGSTLTWSSSNATSCTASGAWSGNEPLSGTQSTGALSSSATYTLTCTGPGGTATQSATVSVSSSTPPPAGLSCTGTSGPLTLKASAVRDTGISPLLVFFDATGTTDASLSGNSTTFQDVTYTWNFGDTGASGTNTWAYGANAGNSSRNSASGGVAAHLYVTPGADSAYTVTVTANDGTNTASCQLGVTAYDPSGSNGFAGGATTCVASSGTPVAGSQGCPAGAAVLRSASFVSALSAHMGNGKRVLFNCGDTFSGTNYTLSATKASIGAYGSCVGTTTNRPILQASASNIMFNMGTSSGDIRITDMVFDGGGQSTVTVFDTMNGGSINSNHPYQYTFYNLDAKRHVYSWRWGAGAQMGLIDSVAEAQTATPYINVFPNYAGTGGSWVTTGTVPNEDYLFFAGNSFTNGAPGNGSYEVMRDSYGSKNIISNNTITNAGPSYAVLKFHNLNYATDGSGGGWSGTYSQYDVISDNYFGGSSGANLVEVSPQNAQSDERMRYIVIERNLFAGSENDGRQLAVSGTNITVRDNVFHSASGSFGVQIAQRGIEPTPQFVQVYNNTCYGGGLAACIAFNAMGNLAPGINSSAVNNLIYNSGIVANLGSGNTILNNTLATISDPGFTNGSGNFSLISDFRPTANYSGGTSVPVFYDALGNPWSPTWDLGAVHP